MFTTDMLLAQVVKVAPEVVIEATVRLDRPVIMSESWKQVYEPQEVIAVAPNGYDDPNFVYETGENF